MITITQIKKERIEIPSQFYKTKYSDTYVHVLNGVDAAGYTECNELKQLQFGPHKGRWELSRNKTFIYQPGYMEPVTAEEYAEAYRNYLMQELAAAGEFGYVALEAEGSLTLITCAEYESMMSNLKSVEE